MSNEQATMVCPKCQTAVSEDMAHCPGCGYAQPTVKSLDLSSMSQQERLTAAAKEAYRDGAGPFSFAFPSVENAYKFHSSGKTSLKTILVILSFGLPIAAVGGPLLYLTHGVIATLLAAIASRSAFFALVGAITLYPGAAALLGYLIGIGVGKGAIVGKCRELNIIERAGVVSGLVGFGAYLLVYTSVLGVAKGFNSAIDFIKLGSYLIAIPLLAWANSKTAVETTPFCDQCGEYMKAAKFGRPASFSEGLGGWPIRYEGALMRILHSRQFEELASLGTGWAPLNFSTITVWFCDRCRERGFVNAETTQTRYEVDNKGNRNQKSETRLIFSSSLEKPEIEKLLAIAATMKT